MTTKLNASTAGFTETVDNSAIIEFQTANTSALVIDASQNANFSSTGAITVPVGTTAQRPTGVNGMVRFNTTLNAIEYFANNSWAVAQFTFPAVNSVAPVISGTAIVGQNLTSTTGTWTNSPTGYYYQWLANSTAIANATANVFTLTSAQNNTNITCNVTAYNAAGNSIPATSNSLGPVLSTYLINKSLRFRASASAYLNRTPASAGNRKTWTWSGWVKRGTLGSLQALESVQNGAAEDSFAFLAADTIRFYGNGQSAGLTTNAVFRDPAAWYHIVLAMDTTQATASNRTKLYVNGVQQTFTGSDYLSQNTDTLFNASLAHYIGLYANNGVYLDGYLTELNFIDGQALTPSSFGQTDSTTGAWVPIAYSGTYGTNGFYLPFSNVTSTTTLGYDSSGNGNNWSTNNFSLTAGATYDSMTDVPTLTSANVSNYSVMNPLSYYGSSSPTYSDGNLKVQTLTSTTTLAFGSMAFPFTGKWYFEFSPLASSNSENAFYCGIASYDISGSCVYYNAGSSGQVYVNGSYNGQSGAAYTINDWIGVGVDSDAGTVKFYKNGSLQVTVTFSVTSKYFFAAMADGSSSSNATYAVNFGQQPWNYAPPADYLPLNTYNM